MAAYLAFKKYSLRLMWLLVSSVLFWLQACHVKRLMGHRKAVPLPNATHCIAMFIAVSLQDLCVLPPDVA